MTRGSTPTHTFTLPYSVDTAKSLRITYSQGDLVKVSKEKSDCEIESNKVIVKLSQGETLGFFSGMDAEVQLKLLLADDTVVISNICKFYVSEDLDGEVIS